MNQKGPVKRTLGITSERQMEKSHERTEKISLFLIWFAHGWAWTLLRALISALFLFLCLWERDIDLIEIK